MAGMNHYIKYLQDESWVCIDSPSGAHYWVEQEKKSTLKYLAFKCIHCKQMRNFPASFTIAISFDTPPSMGIPYKK